MCSIQGDLNYRKLLADRDWAPTTPLSIAAANVPGAAICALRTLKSDPIAGLTEESVARAQSQGADWRIAGTHALVQFLPHTPAHMMDDLLRAAPLVRGKAKFTVKNAVCCRRGDLHTAF